jgi:hypothetical protein
MENEGSLVSSGSSPADASAPQPLVAPTVPSREYFSRRFVVVYTALGLVLVGSVAAFIVYALRPSIDPPAAWSDWRPPAGRVPAVAKEIADHVSPTYHLSQGGQLVAVVPSAPAVTAGTQNVAINAVAVHSRTGNTDVTQLTPGRTEMYTLCGLGEHCAIATGQPSNRRGQLVRREALETALYTFKYLPAIESIIFFMPPPRTDLQATSVLFFERQNLADRLKLPLETTLPLARPPSPDVENTVEGPTIDRITLPLFYASNLTQLQSGGALLVLTPAT